MLRISRTVARVTVATLSLPFILTATDAGSQTFSWGPNSTEAECEATSAERSAYLRPFAEAAGHPLLPSETAVTAYGEVQVAELRLRAARYAIDNPRPTPAYNSISELAANYAASYANREVAQLFVKFKEPQLRACQEALAGRDNTNFFEDVGNAAADGAFSTVFGVTPSDIGTLREGTGEERKQVGANFALATAQGEGSLPIKGDPVTGAWQAGAFKALDYAMESTSEMRQRCEALSNDVNSSRQQIETNTALIDAVDNRGGQGRFEPDGILLLEGVVTAADRQAYNEALAAYNAAVKKYEDTRQGSITAWNTYMSESQKVKCGKSRLERRLDEMASHFNPEVSFGGSSGVLESLANTNLSKPDTSFLDYSKVALDLDFSDLSFASPGFKNITRSGADMQVLFDIFSSGKEPTAAEKQYLVDNGLTEENLEALFQSDDFKRQLSQLDFSGLDFSGLDFAALQGQGILVTEQDMPKLLSLFATPDALSAEDQQYLTSLGLTEEGLTALIDSDDFEFDFSALDLSGISLPTNGLPESQMQDLFRIYLLGSNVSPEDQAILDGLNMDFADLEWLFEFDPVQLRDEGVADGNVDFTDFALSDILGGQAGAFDFSDLNFEDFNFGDFSSYLSLMLLEIDVTPPTVSIVGAPASYMGTTPFAVTMMFSEAVSGFTIEDVAVENAKVSSFQRLDSINYSVQITPVGHGEISIAVHSGVASDLAGNLNLAAATVYVTDATVAETLRVNADFMQNRAMHILSNQPQLTHFFRRNLGGSPGDVFVSQGATGMSYAFSSSLQQVMLTSRSKAKPVYDALGNEVRGGLTVADYDSPTEAEFDLWAKAYGAQSTAGSSESSFFVGYLGGHYFVNANFLVGGIIQADWGEETNSTTGSSVDGLGWMIGPYIAGQLPGQSLSYSLRAAWGKADNTVAPLGTFKDDFKTERWLVNGEVEGSYAWNRFTVTPSASLSYFEEKQEGYTDSVSNSIPSQTVAMGEFRFGPTVSYKVKNAGGNVIEPYAGLTGISNFAMKNDNGSRGVLENGSLRGSLNMGVNAQTKRGWTLSAGGYYDGLGIDNYESVGGSLRLNIPLQ